MDDRELGRPVDAGEQVALALCCLRLGDLDVEAPYGIPLERLAPSSGRREMPWRRRQQRRPREMRDR
ncbi:hypothetical protein [Palleronia rufa]|uniref:hypothetical protein n=1 Tax=Palleronia rufa TaxID=1530186 RepID=UPI0039EF29CE